MYTYAKRTGDVCIASVSLLLLSVIWVLVAACIKADSKGPVLFKQQRYGKDKHPFTIYKFRTMKTDAPKNCATNDLENAGSYITKTGKIIRQLSIDELPQLVNVLRGEMSLIGPRPVILAETDLIAERDKYNANHCTPGITGWAQSNGRDEVNIYEKAKMDGEYAENFGALMDLRCIVKTVETLLFAKGYKEGTTQPILPVLPQLQAQTPVFYSRAQTTAKPGSRIVRRRPITK